MATAEDEDVIEAFVAGAAHPPLGARVRPRRPHRRFDHSHALGADARVERPREFGVAVVQQIAHVLQPLFDREVARLLAHPGAVGVGGHARQVHAPRSVLDEEQHVQGAQPRRLDGEEIARHDSVPLRAQELPPQRSLPARSRPKPERLKIDLIVVAPTRMPSLHNSPWMRSQPQLGFSRPRRNTSSRSAGSSGGRPGERRRYLHFLATSARCHRNRVCGETRNTDQRSRGSSLLAAASSIRSRRPSRGRFTVRPKTAS